MDKEIKKLVPLEELRQKAKSILNSMNLDTRLPERSDLQALAHELQTHQIELELQNRELRAAQDELLQSRDRYMDLYDLAPVGYVTMSDAGLVLEANLTFASMLGCERRNVTQKPLASFIVPEHQDQFYLLVQKNLTSKKRQSAQVQIKRIDKSQLWVNICSMAISDCSDQKNLFRLTITDIGELKKKEEELRQNERLLRLTLDATSDGVFDRNLRTNKVYYGDNWATILGYSQEELQREGITWENLLHPDDRDRALTAVQEHISGQSTLYQAQFRMRQKNGLWKWIQARGKVVEWDDVHQPLRFVGTHTDITRQKQMEEELRNSEQRFRALTELSPAGIYLTDANGDYLYVNKCWCEMSGLSSEEARGQGWLQGIHPDDRNRVLSAWQQLIEQGNPFTQEFRLLAVPTGKTIWVYAVAQSFADGSGGCAGYIGINTDISGKKQAEIELHIAFGELENLIRERTIELEKSYRELQAEVKERRKTGDALRKSEAQLAQEKKELEEVNIALRVLLKKGAEEKRLIEERMMSNVSQLILPQLKEIQRDALTRKQQMTFNLVESNLANITSPFLRNISHFTLRLSPMEVKIAHFVKEGKTSKEIATDLNLSKDTIDIHRKNIRKKCGITGKRQNLRTMLMSFDNQ